jgi:hypothetical protein
MALLLVLRTLRSYIWPFHVDDLLLTVLSSRSILIIAAFSACGVPSSSLDERVFVENVSRGSRGSQ